MMEPSEIQDLVELLIEMGGALAEKGFALALKRTIFVGVADLITSILLFGVGIFLIRITIYWVKKDKENPLDWYDIGSVLSGAGAFCTFIIAPIMLYAGLDYLINPEWNAVQMLLGLIQ